MMQLDLKGSLILQRPSIPLKLVAKCQGSSRKVQGRSIKGRIGLDVHFKMLFTAKLNLL